MSKFFTGVNNSQTLITLTTLTTTNNTKCINYNLSETKASPLAPAEPSGPSPKGENIPASPLGSQPSEVICSRKVIPAAVLPNNWRGLKIDIFNNAARGTGRTSLKVKLGIIRQDGTTQSLIGSMNSPTSYVWRNVPDTEITNFHWTTVRNIQQRFEISNIPYRVSKCSTPNKGNSTNVVVFLLEDDNEWAVSVVTRGQEFNYFLSKDSKLTNLQRVGNIIASCYVGQQSRPLLTEEELGI